MSSATTKKPDMKQSISGAAETIRAVAKPLLGIITWFLPIFIQVCSKAWSFYKALPKNCVKFWTGFCFCFFGGLYPVTFAAVQAAEYGGRKKVVESLTALSEEALIILDESKKDDSADKDNDGVADVNQIENKEFILRKVNLILTKMDPEKVDKAIATLYRVWLSVVAVLMVQFARTISLALSISTFIEKPVNRFITPTIQMATPTNYKRWVPVVLGWGIKAFAMSVAWTIQSVISAFTSGLVGGQTMADATYDFLKYHKYTLGGLIAPDSKDSYVDEAFMYIFAALGIGFQFYVRFDIPFPFNLVVWPLELFEYYLRWTITKAGGQA